MLQRIYLSSEVTMLTNSLKISDQTNAGFFQLNLPRIHGKNDNSSVVLIWQCLEAVNTLLTEWCSEARPFRRLSNQLFRSQ